MSLASAIPEYDYRVHRDIAVTREEVNRLIEALPAEAAESLRTRLADSPKRGELGWGVAKGNLAGVVEELRDMMGDYFSKCQRRPGLPHEECGMYLTRKGTAKFFGRIAELAQAFEATFGLRVGAGEEGPLDPLYYS